MKADLNGSVAVVMGGTKGVGRAIVLKYAECGAQVVFQGRDRADAESLVAQAEKLGPKPVFMPADLDSYEEIKGVIDGTVERFGKVDIAVANGGTAIPKPTLYHEIPPENLVKYYDSRAYNRLYTIRAAVERMKERKYGKIIVTTTDAGRVPTPGESVIGAAASSLIFLTRALGREFTRLGVRINCISFTLTLDTPPYESYRRELEKGSDAVIVKAFKKLEERTPFKMLVPNDLAEMALYLASKESDKLTGATLSINGGISFPTYA